jgi:hypothetical protein
MKAAIIAVLVFFLCLHAAAQTVSFNGTITNKQGTALAFVAIWVNDVNTGSATNEQGFYSINLKPGQYTIGYRSPGYITLNQSINISKNVNAYNLQLQALAANELPDSATFIIQQVIAGHKNYHKDLPAYTGELYSKEKQELSGAPKAFLKKDISHKLHLTPDHKGIISLSESISTFHTRKSDYIKEQLYAAKLTADSNAFGFNTAADLHIDLYKNTLLLYGLSDHGFLSPIASNAPHYYRYTLAGSFTDQGNLIYAINIRPRHKNEHLYNGTIYVIDKKWLLYSAELHLQHNAHIDFIDSVCIRQQFVPLNDGNWVPEVMNFKFYGKLLGFKYSGYFLQLYKSINNDTTASPGPAKEVYHSDKEAYEKTDQFWAAARALPLMPQENQFYTLAELAQRHRRDGTLADSLQNTNNRFSLISYIFNGYTLHNYRNNSSWTFPSPDNLAFYNTVEGFGINLVAKYKKIYTNNQHSLAIIPDARYGFTDHVFNANIFANYVYNPFKQASVYGRIGSDFLDLNDQGTISPFLNSLSTLLLGDNYIKLYQSKFVLAGTTGEVANGVLLNGQIEYAERRPLFNNTLHTFNKDSVYLTSNNPLDPNGNTQLFPPYRALVFRGSATFTFDQEYKITPAGKFIIPSLYPRLRINYRKGIQALGSDVNYDFVSADVFQDRLNMGIYGYTAYFLSSGFFPNKKSLYYPDYQQFSGGESFFFDAFLGSFHFLNYYTYSTDKPYFEAHLEHNFAGYFLSHVPLLSRLNLQEIVGGSFLTQGTLPDYKEVYIGIKRTVVRLDYGLAFGRFTKVMQGFRLSFNI